MDDLFERFRILAPLVLRDITEHRLSAAEVQRLLTTDHLTGAVNRARFFELAGTEIARWHRHRRPLPAVMVDLDRFKGVNETSGHAAGEEVLRVTVERCRTVLRSLDSVARLGGEEFVILLPCTEDVEALEIAERVRAVIAAEPVLAVGRLLDITASLGCATVGDRAENVDILLKLADEALYRAKQLGRNRVEMQSAPDTPVGSCWKPAGRSVNAYLYQYRVESSWKVDTFRKLPYSNIIRKQAVRT